MPTMRRLVLGLNAATVLLVIAGIVLLAVPTPMPGGRGNLVVGSAGSLRDSVRAAAPVADLGAAERVVRTDIFSSRRAAPPRRYVLGEETPESDATPDVTVAPPLAGEPLDSTSASTANDPVPRLYGTMLGPTESTALLRLDGRIAEPRLYRVGDRAGGYRVAEISERSVALVGPSGRLVLRLAQPDQ